MFREYKTNIEQMFLELCQKVVSECGLKLYDMEFIPGSSTLRIYVLNEETNTAVIEDCVKVDHAMSPFIDELEWMPDSLTLEVSSPGVYRELNSKDHLSEAIGEKVLLKLKTNLSDQGFKDLPKKLLKEKKITGLLKEIHTDEICLELANKNLTIKIENIKKATLEPEV